MRECGACQVCCVVADITEARLRSPAGSPCAHQCASGCDLHGLPTRPLVCQSFQCAWLRGVGSDGDRPDQVGVMFSVNRTPLGNIGMAIEAREGALFSTGREMACAFVRSMNLPLVVVKHGMLPPHDTGDWLVLRREHVLRAFAMRGKLIEDFADDVQVWTFAPTRKAA